MNILTFLFNRHPEFAMRITIYLSALLLVLKRNAVNGEIFSALATATPICEFLGMALDKLQKEKA